MLICRVLIKDSPQFTKALFYKIDSFSLKLYK